MAERGFMRKAIGILVALLLTSQTYFETMDILTTNVPCAESSYTISAENQLSTVMAAARTWLYEDDIDLLTNCLYGEARGLDDTQKSAVIWVVLNRVDAEYGTIHEVVTAPNQFTGYNANRILKSAAAVEVWEDCREVVIDVLCRWYAEKLECENIGRTLPKNYMWYGGDGKVNWFRDNYNRKECNYWDWSLESPYSDNI